MLMAHQGTLPPGSLGTPHDDFVEIGLLLPKNRASALLRLAQERKESVGQLLRKLVDRELCDGATT